MTEKSPFIDVLFSEIETLLDVMTWIYRRDIITHTSSALTPEAQRGSLARHYRLLRRPIEQLPNASCVPHANE